jgi:hypothetical protein
VELLSWPGLHLAWVDGFVLEDHHVEQRCIGAHLCLPLECRKLATLRSYVNTVRIYRESVLSAAFKMLELKLSRHASHHQHAESAAQQLEAHRASASLPSCDFGIA